VAAESADGILQFVEQPGPGSFLHGDSLASPAPPTPIEVGSDSGR
jgi:hypothetical protein